MNRGTYTNIILTAIAVLLLVVATQAPVRLNLATSAHAASQGERDVPTQISMDPDLARATAGVATANQEIAKQLGAVAKAIEKVATAIEKSAGK